MMESIQKKGHHTVQFGEHVVCCVNGERYYIKTIDNNDHITLHKQKVVMSQFVGLPYGRVWRVGGGGSGSGGDNNALLVEVKPGDDVEDHVEEILANSIERKEKKDKMGNGDKVKGEKEKKGISLRTNKKLFDNNTAQKLSQEDIEKMQESGVDGATIIKTLMTESDTFKDKTQFAQRKYIKRKKKKYCANVQVIRATGLNISTALFQRQPSKIGHIRPDAIGQILTLGNIHYGTNILLAESCNGLLAGCILERLGGKGRIIRMYEGGNSGTGMGSMCHFCFSKEKLDLITHIPFNILKKTRSPSFTGKMDSSILSNNQKLLCNGTDSLIVATECSSIEITLRLFSFLKPSGVFVVYSHTLENLAWISDSIKKKGLSTNISITETWLRNYQVLSDISRPAMRMHGASGYILSGTKVISELDIKKSLSPIKKKQRTSPEKTK